MLENQARTMAALCPTGPILAPEANTLAFASNCHKWHGGKQH
jgi:hypothetical protein